MSLLSSLRKKIFDFFSQKQKKFRKFQRQHDLDKKLVASLNKTKFPSWKQWRYLPKILNQKEARKLQLILIVFLLAIFSLLGQGFFLMTEPLPKAGGQYTEGLIGSPRLINPILAQTNDVDQDLAGLIFSGLVKYDQNRQLVNDLAEKMEISEDQLSYTFYLRKDVKWHDGNDFNADDVIFTVTAIQNPEYKSPLSRSFRGVTLEKIDDFTVKFILKEPFAPFLALLTVGILPEHLWYNITPASADLSELNKKPIGSGAWKFESFKKDANGNIKAYTLIKNGEYYNQKPYLDKLVFKFFGDFQSGVDALKSKAVQGLAYLPKEQESELKKYKNVKLNNINQPQYTAIFFNQKRNELLKSDYIRQAMALSINKQRIVEQIFNNEGQVIDGPALPGIEFSSEMPRYDYNSTAAAELLEKNGWKLGSTTTADGITEQVRFKKNYFLEITLTTVDQAKNVETAKMIQESWEQIGIKTNINIVDKSKIVQDVINSRKYEALLFGESLGSDPDPFPFWHSTQNEYPGLNLAIFSNKTVDQLLEEGRKTNNWDDRKKAYTQFQNIIAQAVPAIFLYSPNYIYPQNKEIKGFNLATISAPSDRFSNINEWYIKTTRIWK